MASTWSSVRCSSPKVTTCSTASKTLSQEVRNASAVSFQESRRAQRARNSMYALVSERLPSLHGTSSRTTVPQRRQFTRRMAYRKEDEKTPKRNELEAPCGELVVAGCRMMAARTDRGGALARPHRDLDTLLVWTEAGVLVDKSREA